MVTSCCRDRYIKWEFEIEARPVENEVQGSSDHKRHSVRPGCGIRRRGIGIHVRIACWAKRQVEALGASSDQVLPDLSWLLAVLPEPA